MFAVYLIGAAVWVIVWLTLSAYWAINGDGRSSLECFGASLLFVGWPFFTLIILTDTSIYQSKGKG